MSHPLYLMQLHSHSLLSAWGGFGFTNAPTTHMECGNKVLDHDRGHQLTPQDFCFGSPKSCLGASMKMISLRLFTKLSCHLDLETLKRNKSSSSA